MPTFQYNIINADGTSSKGQINAQNRKSVKKTLEGEGAKVVSVIQIKDKKKTGGLLIGRKVLTSKRLPVFTRQLASLISAGIPLVRSLRTLQKQAEKADPLGAFVIRTMADDVESGDNFSIVLSRQKASFPQFYVSMMEAAEESGAMATILNRLAIFLEKSSEIRRKVKSAMTYPVVILFVATAITYGLMVVIVPKITTMIIDIGEGKIELPVLTKTVVTISDFLQANILLSTGGIIIFAIGFKIFSGLRFGKIIIDNMKFFIPVFSGIYKKVVLARFTQNLGTLLNAGVPIVTALKITDRSCDNAVISKIMFQVGVRVQDGENVGKIFSEFNFFPVMLVSMIEVGEESGSMPEMLERVAKLYEDEVSTTIEGLSSIIEPIMMVGLSLIIGTIVIAMFLPMIAILQNLSG